MSNPAQPIDTFSEVCALILAAGKGTRMMTKGPKVLQTLLQTPMLWYVYQALEGLLPPEKVWSVVGYERESVRAAFPGRAERFIVQAEQLGTGHALQCALETLAGQGNRWCLVVNGDVPLLTAEALAPFVQNIMQQRPIVGFLTLELSDPSGYGRVLRHEDGRVRMIVEEKDLGGDASLRAVQEVNSGIYCVDLDRVRPYLKRLDANNRQGEYYITQLVDLCVQDGKTVAAVKGGTGAHFLGVNSPAELAACETFLRKRIVESFLNSGVIIHHPDQVCIAPQVRIAPGVEITGPSELYGDTQIEKGARLDSHLWILDSRIGERSWIRNFSHLEGVILGEQCQVGPFARLRPGAELRSGAKAGNFVEIKKSLLDTGCKVNHLSYIGDAYLGQEVNVGAGTITCNYDGQAKHRTSVGKQAFIGSNTALVAPVHIGEKSVIGAGSVVTRDVPDGMLAVTRAKQKHLDWKHKRGRDS